MSGTLNKGTLDKGSLVKTFGGGGSSPTPPTPTPQGEYFVKVIDYDGTVIDEQWLDDGAEYTLPSAPSHEGLVFQEWSSSETITDGKITIDKNNVMIGTIYTTSSGQNEFDIELTANTGLTITLNIDGDKDWGDGSSVDNLTTHTYSQEGKYTIKTDGTTITSTSNVNIFGQSYSDQNSFLKEVRFATIETITAGTFTYCVALKYASLSNKVSIVDSLAFDDCYSLKSLVYPKGITSLPGNCHRDNRELKHLVIPSSVTTLSGNSMNGCCLLETTIPKNLTTFLQYGGQFGNNYMMKRVIVLGDMVTQYGSEFSNCYSVEKVKIHKISNIRASMFSNCYSCLEYDFTECSSVPTLANINAFNHINSSCKIKVPSSLVAQWKSASNWVTYADYIVGV